MSIFSNLSSTFKKVKKAIAKLPTGSYSANASSSQKSSSSGSFFDSKKFYSQIAKGSTKSGQQTLAPTNGGQSVVPGTVGGKSYVPPGSSRVSGSYYRSGSSGSTSNKTSSLFSPTALAFLSSSSPQQSTQGISFAPRVSSIPSTNVVNSTNLKNTPDLIFPDKGVTEVPTITPGSTEDQIQNLQKQKQTDFQDYLDTLKAPPSQEDAYKRAQKETDIFNKQNTVNELTNKLNSIVAKGEANKLSLVGQGRGIPEAIIGGQQAEIGRETAIAALPVQAQLSAAQGDLATAEENLNTLFKIYSDDATNEYNYRKSVNEAIYNFASSENQSKIEALQKKQDREYAERQADIQARNSIALEATKNGASAAVISAISNAPNFASALSAAGSFLQNTQVVKLDNGETVVIDSMGRVIRNLGGASVGGGNSFIVDNEILKNTYGNDIVSLIAGTIQSSGAKQSQSTNDAINVIAGLQQLVKDNPDGSFEGLAPIRLTPGKFKTSASLINLSNIEAINLKVQQWASGAALTEAQTKQVNQITPRKGDTDKQIRAKINALANHMISEVGGQLAGQGVSFIVDTVDLFQKTPEQELRELYQNPTMKQKIEEAASLYPNYTDAEILQIIKI